MIRLVLAALCAAAPAPLFADIINVNGWTLNRAPGGCTLYTSFEGGTTLSIFGDSTEDVMFTLQNRKWASLKEDKFYNIIVEFDDKGEWPIRAMATQLDGDGPGISFIMPVQDNENGDNFVAEFALSAAMRVKTRSGKRIDGLSMAGTRDATVAFGACLRRFNRGTDPFKDVPGEEATVQTQTI